MIQVLTKADHYGTGPKRLIVIGPPGTGKTHAALKSFVFPALEQGIDHSRIGVFSFSVAAASELRERVAKKFGIDPESLREMCSTIHSEALRRISVSQSGWMLYDGLTREFQPLRGGRNKAKRIDDNFGKPSSIRAAAISIWDYVRNVCKEEDVEFIKSIATRAKNTLTGVSATVRTLMGNMAVYEREKKAQPLGIDFTDMLMEAANTPGRSLELMIVDEAQDSSPLQWRVIEKWARMARTVVLIGDPDQCHPAGTQITMAGSHSKSIEDVRPGDAVAYLGIDGHTYGLGEKGVGAKVLRVGERAYEKPLYEFNAGGLSYQCTHDHRCVVRSSRTAGDQYALYLARKGSRFRIGLAQYLFKGKGANGVVSRAKVEGADAAWILDTFDDRQDGIIAERITSLKYQIPQAVWTHGEEFLRKLYRGIPSTLQSANRCLKDYGRDLHCPFWSKHGIGTMKPQGFRRFTIYACNVIEGIHEMMTQPKSSQVAGVWRPVKVRYAVSLGSVYSLSVEDKAKYGKRRYANSREWRNYFANGILTHNCIHEWAGASPEHFTKHIDEGYELRKLAQSYRVPRAIHKKARKIILLNKDRIDAEYQPMDADGEVRNLNEKQVLELCKATALANKKPYSDEDEILAEMSGYELPDPIPALFILSRDRRGCSRYSNLLTDHAVPFINERGPCLHTSPAKLAVISGIISLKRTGEIGQRELRHLLESLPVRGNKYWENPKVQVLGWLTKVAYTMEDIIKLGVRIEDLTETELMTAIHSSRMKVTAPQAEMARIMANTYGLESLSLKPNILVTTIHASKGREAETVVVSAQKPFPIQLNYNDRKKKEIEAERRTLYVACTRARKTLIIDKTGKELYGELL